MERIDDFRKVVKICLQSKADGQVDLSGIEDQIINEGIERANASLSSFAQVALKISLAVKMNEAALSKMGILSTRKEFSNDPSAEMAELSESFHNKVIQIKQNLQLLKQMSEDVNLKSQHRQHYSLMTQTLTKILTTQVQDFKVYANTHANNLKQRQQRVAKYGQGLETSGLRGIEQQQQQYAMFSSPPSINSGKVVNNLSNGNGETSLRRRANPTHKSPYLNINSSSLPPENDRRDGQQQQLQQVAKNRAVKENRLSNAQKIEATVAQMGDLFTQLTNLVMQQSETISRIEDDIEIGLEETKKAHVYMERFYEISKGNRSMILKIFALLIIFIFLFLYLT